MTDYETAYEELETQYDDILRNYELLLEKYEKGNDSLKEYLITIQTLSSASDTPGQGDACEEKLATATTRIQQITDLVKEKISELQGGTSPGGRRFQSSTADDSSFVLGGIRVSRGLDRSSSEGSSRSSSASSGGSRSSRTSKSSGTSQSSASSGAWSYGGHGVSFS